MKSSRPLACSALLAAALASSASPASAAVDPLTSGELVSRSTGADGVPFAASTLFGVSADGRFVLMSGPYSEAVSAPAYDRVTLFVRDRETDATIPVLRADGALGAVWSWVPGVSAAEYAGVDVSDDGRQVLFSGPKQDGAPGRALYLRDLSAGTTTVVSATTAGAQAYDLAGTARFIDGGTAIVYGTKSADGRTDTLERALPNGAPKTTLAGVAANSASADGDVLTWTRPLRPAKRPVVGATGPGWPKERAGVGIGYTVRGVSRLVARTTVLEHQNAPLPFCAAAGAGYTSTNPERIEVDDSGRSLWTQSSRADSAYPDLRRSYLRFQDLGATGRRALLREDYVRTQRPGRELVKVALDAQATLPTLPNLPSLDFGGVWTDAARFYADDAGIVRAEYREPNSTRSEESRGIYAYDPVAPGVPATPGTPTAQPGEIADDAALTPDVTWVDCPAPVPPKATDFVTAKYNAPFGSLKPIGDFTVDPHPQNIDGTAKKVTFTVKTFGFTTWSKTVEGAQTPTVVTVPKPYVFLPGTLTVSATVTTPQDEVGTTVSFSKSWFVWR